MIYSECTSELENLRNFLSFQERRNFFNKQIDKNLNLSITILESVIERAENNEYRQSDYRDVIFITLDLLHTLNIPPEAKSSIGKLNCLAKKLT